MEWRSLNAWDWCPWLWWVQAVGNKRCNSIKNIPLPSFALLEASTWQGLKCSKSVKINPSHMLEHGPCSITNSRAPSCCYTRARGMFSLLSSFHSSLQVIVAMLCWGGVCTEHKAAREQVTKVTPKPLTARLGKHDGANNRRTLLLEPSRQPRQCSNSKPSLAGLALLC